MQLRVVPVKGAGAHSSGNTNPSGQRGALGCPVHGLSELGGSPEQENRETLEVRLYQQAKDLSTGGTRHNQLKSETAPKVTATI